MRFVRDGFFRTFQTSSDGVARRLSQGALKLSVQVTFVAQGHIQLFVGNPRSAGLLLLAVRLGGHRCDEQGAGQDEDLQHNYTYMQIHGLQIAHRLLPNLGTVAKAGAQKFPDFPSVFRERIDFIAPSDFRDGV